MNNFIMGRNTVEEVLRNRPEIILHVYVNLSEKNNLRKDSLIQEIEKKNISLEYVSKSRLFSLTNSESHQSFVAKIKSRNFLELKSFLKQEKKSSFVLMLDNIVDPHNMGAIFRSAECFNVDAIVYSKNRGVDINPVVSKVSCGATELVPVIRVSNLSTTATEFQKAGYDIIVTENSENAKNLFNFTFPQKTLLIMGSEGLGVQKILKDNADISLKIPMFGKISSLNVAQATAVILAFKNKESV